MWNPVTNGVHTTRDVIWLKRMFYKKEMGQNIIINPELLPDFEEAGTTGIRPQTPVVNNVPVQGLDNLDQAVVMSR
jgi:hypothetical protein